MTTPVPGGLLDRFLARLIDSILVAILDFAVTSLIIVGVSLGSSDVGTSSYAAGAALAVIAIAISLGYFSYGAHARPDRRQDAAQAADPRPGRRQPERGGGRQEEQLHPPRAARA